MPLWFASEFDWPSLLFQSERSIHTRAPVTLVTGTTVFTINGGPIIIRELVSVCVTANDTTAATLQWSADGFDGAATTFTGATATTASAAAGAAIVAHFTATTTAPVIYAAGVGISRPTSGNYGGMVVPAGIITTTIGTGPTTGTWRHYMRYTPMGTKINVSAAF